MAIIQIQDVSKKFQTKDGEIDALKHVTLDIEAGDIYGIIGMSGAGKSTLVRCINHIEVPTEGTVIVQDKDLSKLSEKELRKQREHMSRSPEVLRSRILADHRHRRYRALCRRDAGGRRYMIDGHRKCGLMVICVVLHHLRKLQLPDEAL